MVQLNIVDDPREIFTQVLNALESHRESKAELGVLDALAEEYGLPDDHELWVEHLLTSRVEVDAFLKFTLACIEPFVLMVLELYSFLHEHVSTTGGRTQQFRIVSDDLANPWTFDVSKLPKQIQWISAWMDMEIEEVEIDWERLNLGNDNGIFYAGTHDVRLAQSLVVARRDGSLSAEARSSATGFATFCGALLARGCERTRPNVAASQASPCSFLLSPGKSSRPTASTRSPSTRTSPSARPPGSAWPKSFSDWMTGRFAQSSTRSERRSTFQPFGDSTRHPSVQSHAN